MEYAINHSLALLLRIFVAFYFLQLKRIFLCRSLTRNYNVQGERYITIFFINVPHTEQINSQGRTANWTFSVAISFSSFKIYQSWFLTWSMHKYSNSVEMVPVFVPPKMQSRTDDHYRIGVHQNAHNWIAISIQFNVQLSEQHQIIPVLKHGAHFLVIQSVHPIAHHECGTEKKDLPQEGTSTPRPNWFLIIVEWMPSSKHYNCNPPTIIRKATRSGLRSL